MRTETNEEIPIWKFDRVRLYYLNPIIKNNKKSSSRCYASIDFGFFYVMDIGLTKERYDDADLITWSVDFGWGRSIRFSGDQIDNPYAEEVYKLQRMVKEELERNRSKIIDFLDDPSTAPMMIKEE